MRWLGLVMLIGGCRIGFDERVGPPDAGVADAAMIDSASGTADAAMIDSASGTADAAMIDGASVTCPASYLPRPTGCYRFAAIGATAADAEAACGVDGGHLAIITSSAENLELTTLEGTSSAWFGFVDVGAGFVPVTTGAPPSFTNWAPGDPTGDGSCARLLQTTGDWDDEPCTDVRPYLCEVDGDATVVTVP